MQSHQDLLFKFTGMKKACLCLFFPAMLFAQKKQWFDFTKIQSGPYIGVQQGRNLVFELGYERRSKEIKLKNASSHAFNIGANYDYRAGILGADAGFWFRPNRFGLTFGAQVAARSNFDQGMLGFTPTVGYKIWFIHANAGYYIYPKPLSGAKTNNLFVQVRWVFSENSRTVNNGKRKGSFFGS